jgi:mannosyltransferase OCH1-like enzyme
MNIAEKVYGKETIFHKFKRFYFKNCKFNKLKNINFVIKDFFELVNPLNLYFLWCIEKKYDENNIYNKLKTIKCTNFEIKDSYNSVVPLNIYLTWGIKQLPEKMQENVDRMRIVNPEFNIQLYDDNDCREFIKNNFLEDILIAFDTLKPGAYKADLWRLCILYINGGIYIDIKLNCINNFKFIALTEKEHFVIDTPDHWKEGEIGLWNGLMVAKPKNILLLRCINKISKNVKNKNYDFNLLYPTGPGLLGEEYIKMLKENKSTLELELNKLDLCLDISTGKYYIIFNNVAILTSYKEYRTEQKLFAKTQHYGEIYFCKQIYNENILEFLLFCVIIIVFLFSSIFFITSFF